MSCDLRAFEYTSLTCPGGVDIGQIIAKKHSIICELILAACHNLSIILLDKLSTDTETYTTYEIRALRIVVYRVPTARLTNPE